MNVENALYIAIALNIIITQLQIRDLQKTARERMFIMLEVVQQMTNLLQKTQARAERARRLPEERPMASMDRDFQQMNQQLKAAHEYNGSKTPGSK